MKRLLATCATVIFLTGCGVTQGTIQDRNLALGTDGERQGSNFAEAKQIQAIETWKDDPGKIVFLYVNFPPGSDNTITVQCQGVPASSTESLEPNQGVPWYASGPGDAWRMPIDGVDTGTNEMAGRDGTFGDPVPFRQCMTVDGNYIDVPGLGVPYLVSSVPYTFPPSTVKRDFEGEARLLQAEQIIRRGGCVNAETLQEQPCPAQEPRPTVAPTPEGEQ